ncbi:MAG: hypothetical protein AAGA20_12625 [Planctomycetota bacterium]
MSHHHVTWACSANDCYYTEPIWRGHYCAWCGSDLMPVEAKADSTGLAPIRDRLPRHASDDSPLSSTND